MSAEPIEFQMDDPEIGPDDSNSDVQEQKYYLKRKLTSVDWNEEDRKAIETVRAHAGSVYLEIFGNTLGLIDEVYNFVRDYNGDENWGLLTTKQLEAFVLKLSEERIQTTLQLKEVQMDALFAKYSLEDDYHAAYLSGSGTNPVREARAHTNTTDRRYSYFYRYFIWTMCEGLSKEIDALVKNLNSTLYRRGSNA